MILQELARLKAIVIDVDGVLTDGTVQVDEHGEQLRTFNVKDGYAMHLAMSKGLQIIVISGGRNAGVQRRLEGLGIQEIHLGVADKLTLLQDITQRFRIELPDVMFIGDDMPDYKCMKAVGVAACPADAVEEIKQISHYVSGLGGGKGVVRELIEKTLKLQDKWYDDTNVKSV
ncbi:KdsC family phosphatase [Sphingobacterium spiritivorum]|uniref:3-deoxy-D-manno-octulosonate 8-phosphate phosphatase, YrbI family n=1 Tax=Sphingobacterium spiritivorum ATCC 33861 TaxID=525373 RepID=D7VGN8_SPHSI|nr:HAD-IIIA family hydrolase [Sphingobacterium spiritivorum]EFK59240.1 3-deoxy-D-manno-octulosonate 8-phosphate phosphatase, YrbI family [Sphingobacterium spiritivorum ATCC 33861]QQT34057.1 HAD-IIIA family hydrolase [Sphingobacterium spiritivorum]WQD34886.1 HAD-IIIA family hydrolase [Sphingobacterium spiritivorum]SUI98616.1 3-deoxy-D-manno-octulosonate 8-phosphate phosphatase KdsC [Sphingobacterium spiritivorum]